MLDYKKFAGQPKAYILNERRLADIYFYKGHNTNFHEPYSRGNCIADEL